MPFPIPDGNQGGHGRKRFLLMIILVVAAIYGLWGLSLLVNSSAEPEKPAEESADDRIGRTEYEIGQAERFADEGDTQKATEYVSELRPKLEALEKETLRPAERYRLRGVNERLTALGQRLGKSTERGTSQDGPSSK
jgi:hypothetical protein